MHKVSIRQHIIDRVVARRGDVHWFTRLDPAKSALVIVDRQNTFCQSGAPGEVAASRDIVPAINRLTTRLRALGAPVIWCCTPAPTTRAAATGKCSSTTWCGAPACASA